MPGQDVPRVTLAEFRDIRTHSHPVEVGDLSADIAAEMGLVENPRLRSPNA